MLLDGSYELTINLAQRSSQINMVMKMSIHRLIQKTDSLQELSIIKRSVVEESENGASTAITVFTMLIMPPSLPLQTVAGQCQINTNKK